MTATDLRTGAALVRALIDGDDSVRGPLSDWLEQYASPLQRWPQHLRRAIDLLRDFDRPVCCGVLGQTGQYRLVWARTEDCDPVTIGQWPAWAWEPLALEQ